MSLLEALVATLLLGTVAALIAVLARDYGKIINFNRGKSNTAEAQRAIETLCQESACAVTLISPDGPGLSDFVEYKIVDTFGPDRLKSGSEWDEDYENVTEWGVFTPRRDSNLLKVRYTLRDGSLQRDVTDHQGKTLTATISEEIAGFTASKPEQHLLKFEISVLESTRLVTLSGKACLWFD
jgi:hypothetical protein